MAILFVVLHWSLVRVFDASVSVGFAVDSADGHGSWFPHAIISEFGAVTIVAVMEVHDAGSRMRRPPQFNHRSLLLIAGKRMPGRLSRML